MEFRAISKENLHLDIRSLAGALRIEDEADLETFEQYGIKALEIALPKAVYRSSYIEDRGEDWVRVDDTVFSCRLMVRNFSPIHRVFPFAATCGREIYEWARTITDPLEQYWVDHIMEVMLKDMLVFLNEDIGRVHGIGKLSCMNPGTLEDWPIEEQPRLFALIGDVKNTSGIVLTESYLMVPQKSVSGILFPSEAGYSNCKLCQRAHCPSRLEPFEENLRHVLLGEGKNN